jgi:exopolysaccharide biosynthesis polyprenyl glycosylphosphotransferase
MLVPPVDAVMLTLPALWAPSHTKAVVAVAALTLLLLTSGRCYRARLHLSVLDELPWLIARFSTAVAIVATFKALRHEREAVAAFLVLSLLTAALLLLGRVLTTQGVLWSRRRGWVAHSTVIVGSGPIATELVAILDRYPRYGLRVAGFVDDVRSDLLTDSPWLGPQNALHRIVAEREISVILVADTISEVDLLDLVWSPLARSLDFMIVPRFHQLHSQTGLPDHVGCIPVMRVNNPALRGPAWMLKRLLDVLVSAFSLLLLIPLLLIIAALVRREGGAGVLFRQERIGQFGEPFTCLKFRTLKPAESTESATLWSIASDSRVGPVGRILRRTSFDELPQLWNILRGDMTLVGPRPERPHFVDRFSMEIPSYGHRHRVRAGLTGFAQVSGLRGDTPIIDRARFDNYYIENWSLWMDAKILLRTVGEVLFARGR